MSNTNIFTKTVLSLTAAASLFGLSACGDATPNEAPATQVTVVETVTAEPSMEETDVEYLPEEDLTAVVYNDSQIIEHLGLDHNNEILISEGVWCEASAILNSVGAVDLYADAGDVVATAPMGTAGVKVGGAEQKTCLDYFTNALADFPEGESAGLETPAERESAAPVVLDGEQMKALIGEHLGLGEGGVVTTPDGMECDAGYAIYDKTTLNEATVEGDIVAVNAQGFGVTSEGLNSVDCKDFFVLAMKDFSVKG